MPKAIVARPFVWRSGHTNVLVKKGEQALTPEQLAHAEKHGFLQQQAPVKNATKTTEVTQDE